ncbi:MAG: hypothetical protein IKG56_01450 [Clostridia bacterium]|nr:hypothetical protein [Clostridia bacterium]
MSILTKFKRKETEAEQIDNNLIKEKKALSESLLLLAIDDELYAPTLEKIETIDSLITKKEKKKFKIDPVIGAALISTLGFVGIAVASMKYEDDGNIIQHTAGKTAMNKLGR